MKNLFKILCLFVIFSYAQNKNVLIKKILNSTYKNYETKENYTIKFQYLINNPIEKLYKKNVSTSYYNKKKYNISLFQYNYIFDGKNQYQIDNKNKEITIVNKNYNDLLTPIRKLNFYKKKFTINNNKYNSNNTIQEIYLNPINSKQNISTVKLTINLSKKEILELKEIYKNGTIVTIKILNFNYKTKLNNNLFILNQNKYRKYQIIKLY